MCTDSKIRKGISRTWTPYCISPPTLVLTWACPLIFLYDPLAAEYNCSIYYLMLMLPKYSQNYIQALHCHMPHTCSMEVRYGDCASQGSWWTYCRACWVAWASCRQALFCCLTFPPLTLKVIKCCSCTPWCLEIGWCFVSEYALENVVP